MFKALLFDLDGTLLPLDLELLFRNILKNWLLFLPIK